MKNNFLCAVAIFGFACVSLAYTSTVEGRKWYYSYSWKYGEKIAEITGVAPATGDLEIPISVDSCWVKSIGVSAFSGCTGITSVTMPFLEKISDSAFAGCTGLRSIEIASTMTTIGRYAFSDCSNLTSIIIPSKVSNIRESTFSGCSGLTSVTISSGVTKIEEYAFYGCSGLSTVSIPSSIDQIDCRAFSSCDLLQEINVDSANLKFASIDGVVFNRDHTEILICPNGMTNQYDIPKGVSCIGDCAFSCCKHLTIVTIPEGVTSIGNYAFSKCSGLTSVTIPDGVTCINGDTFNDCAALKSVDIPLSVTNIGSYAFYNCSNLTSVTIPLNVTEIGSRSFYNCKELKKITISNGVTSIGESAFSGCCGLTSVTIPASVTNIADGAFSDCSGLVSVAITAREIDLGDNVFDGCNSIKEVVVPGWKCGVDFSGVTNLVITDGATDIRDNAFCDCTELASVTIPQGVTCIGDSAFSGCDGLLSISIPSSVTKIGSNAFAGCSGLGNGVIVHSGCVLNVSECPEHVVIPEGTRLIADGAFRNCSELVSITLPQSLKHIGANAFEGCTNLEYIELPEGLESIGDSAFRDCTWMQEIAFSSSVTNIGAWAFANCTMLESIECYDGLQSIGECAFSNCWRMLSVALPTTVATIGASAFHNCKSVLGVTVPAHIDTLANLFPDVYKTLQSVAVAEGETNLVASFFYGCQMIQEVALSNSIREIPDSTFEGCSELLRMQFPTDLERIGNRAFYGCCKLSSLEFPDNLVSIGNFAFYGCSQANVISFGEKLREIGDDAFNGLPKIRDITCPRSVRSIGIRAFKGVWDDVEIKLPEELESLGVDAFADNQSIRRIVLPAVATPIKTAFSAAYTEIESVKILGAPETIPQEFCRDIVQIGAIQIPSSVTNIGRHAFSGLSNLASIDLPSGLRSIGECAFSRDSRITTVALPQSVETVGTDAFYGCGNIRVVSCSGELGTLSSLFPTAYQRVTTVSINEGTKFLLSDLMSDCYSLSDIDLPVGITNIGARAFKQCWTLSSFGVPSGVVKLGDDVFSGCTAITSLSLPAGLTEIPSGAFRNCSSISSMVIPASVNYVGADAFYGCSSLVSISYLGSCPLFDSGCYNGTPSDLVSYVVFGSRGWDGLSTSKALPEYWPTVNARAITYWEPNTFEATFNGNGGTPTSSKAVQTTGTTYLLPENDPEMLGARFNGWWTQPVNGGRIKSTTKVEVTRAQTFYAHWKYNNYSVRFDANGGIGEMEDQELTVNTSSELPKNGFVRKNYRFEGWALSPDGEVAFADGSEALNLSFEHNTVVPLYAVWSEHPWNTADYLNASGRQFEFDGDAEWTADDEISHDGMGSMRSGAIAAADDGQRTSTILRTHVIGMGSGSFLWKTDCEPDDDGDYFDYCVFRIDDVVIAQIAGKTDWEEINFEITEGGEHILEWEFTRDDWDENESLYENAAWVDEFKWVPTPVVLSFDANGADGEVPESITKYASYEVLLPNPVALSKDGMVFRGWTDGENVYQPSDVYTFGSSDSVLRAVWEEKVWTLEEAIGVTNLTIATGGDVEWLVDLTTNYDGAASIRSGSISDNQSTWVALTVSGSGTLEFRTLVSGEYYRGKLCDYLKFEVDDVEVFSSYDANWSNVVVAVSGSGSHLLKWTYLKNDKKSAGYDCAWIDNVVWTAADPIPELIDPTVERIKEVLNDATDKNLSKNITNETDYADFRMWAGAVKPHGGNAAAGAEAVMAAPNAWLSFAIASDSLIDTAPTNGQMRVEKFEPTSKVGSFDFTVGIDDIAVGAAATAENLKKVFGLEGGTTIDALSSTNVDITFGTPENGKVKFTAGPNAKNADAKTFFMKVKMTP